jgi:hypothetical protein
MNELGEQLFAICVSYLDFKSLNMVSGILSSEVTFPPLQATLNLCELIWCAEKCRELCKNPSKSFNTVCNFQKCADRGRQVLLLVSKSKHFLMNPHLCDYLNRNSDWLRDTEFFSIKMRESLVDQIKEDMSDIESGMHYIIDLKKELEKKISGRFMLMCARFRNRFV